MPEAMPPRRRTARRVAGVAVGVLALSLPLGVSATALPAGAATGRSAPQAGEPATANQSFASAALLRPPPPPGGRMSDLGSPMQSLTVVEGAFGRLPDGTFAAYAAPMGENAELNVSTTYPEPNKQLGRYPMKGASGDPSIAVAPDGTVYIGTFYDGHLFRWDPATKVMTDLGRPTPGASYLYGLSVSPDGTVYGGSHPDAKAWSYSAAGGFVDLGRPTDDPTVTYVRSTAYDPEHHALYVGTSPVAKVFRIDLRTKAVTETAMRPNDKPASEVSDLDYADGQVLVNYGGKLRAIDTASNAEVAITDGDTGAVVYDYAIAARGVSPARRGGVYTSVSYASAVHVVRYDLATHTVKRTGVTSRRGGLVGYGWNVEGGHDVLYAFAGNYSGGGFRYDIDSGAARSLQLAVTSPPSPLQHVLPAGDGGKVYVNTFLNGNTSVYDVATGTATPVDRLGQVEDWTISDGLIHAGTYPSGALVSAPEGSGKPVTTYARLKDSDAQIRPLEVKEHGGRIWYGTAPDYGQRGGAIAVLDPTTKAVDVTRNVVPDHTISSLAFVGDALFAGSSTEGGTGTTPLDGDARLVQWDPVAKKVLRSVAPVQGARSINALTSHNGHLYGLADGTIFEADPRTLAVTRRMSTGVSGAAAANDGELVFHPNGYLYASTGDSLVVVDPLSFSGATRVAGNAHRLEPSPDRTLWTTLRPEGFTNFLNLGRFTPTATRCADPDTRDYLTIFGIVTPIRNRFIETGCTLQDLIPKTASRGSYAGTINPWLDRLVERDLLTAQERDAIWQVAKRGR